MESFAQVILDWQRIVALILLFVVGGGFGVFELILTRRRSARGGFGWLIVIFAIDAIVALLAYLFLDAALADEFWGDPIVIYLAALIWSPFLLRTQFEFLVPGGPAARDLFRVLPASREFLASRVHIASARYVSNWMGAKVVPSVLSAGLKSMVDGAEDFFRNLTSLQQDRMDALVIQLRGVEHDLASPVEDRIRSIAQIMIDNGALTKLKSIVSA